MADQPNDFLSRLRATFQVEAGEHLQSITANLVVLEQADEAVQKEFVDRILKRLHTFKGAARAVNLTDLETLCHAMEDVFSAILMSGRALSPEQFDIIHRATDLARSLSSEPSGRMRNQAVALAAQLGRLSAEISVAAHNNFESETVVKPIADNLPDGEANGEPAEHADSNPDRMAQTDVISVQGKSLDAVRYHAEAFLSVELGLQHHIEDLQTLASEIAEQCDRMQLADAGSRKAKQKKRAARAVKAPHNEARNQQESAEKSEARARSVEAADYIASIEARCRDVAAALGRTRRSFVTSRAKLMEATLETALVPLGSALDQLPGLVRNLARSHGKEAALSVQGEGVHIDRRILAVVRDVLMHLVTNAVAHGIEPALARLAAGKPAAGMVRVTLSQTGGNEVAVTVHDDGGGIDLSGLVKAAIRTGDLQPEQLAGLSDQQKRQLALHSGVSTSVEVTQVSGRGVGLAIVAEKVASVGGKLFMDSSAGAGSSFHLLLPVRLATFRGLVVRIGTFRYVIPLSGIESVRALKVEDIQTVESRETLVVRERVIPALRLRSLLHLERSDNGQTKECIAVIVRAGEATFSLLIDEILSEQEVLPKSIGKQLRRVRYIAGATQLGDSSLVPILALDDIDKYGIAADGGASVPAKKAGASPSAKRMLVVEDSITSRLLLKHILESAGYLVETAVDGLDAMSKLRQEHFDAVVSDIEMPQLDGLALTERIRSNPKTEGMPVILVTSLQSPEEKARGLHAGADAYVVKGAFDQDNLLTTIRRLV